MAGPIKDPNINQQAPRGIDVDLMDVADFLFGVRSIEKIVKGQGSWGDLFNVGITAATFLIPPAKLLKLSGPALNKVIVASEKTAATEGLSIAAKRAAQTTADNAKELMLNKVPGKTKEPVPFRQISDVDQFGNPTTQLDELGNRVPIESKYYGTGSSKTKKQIAEDKYEAKPKLKSEDIKRVKPTEEERKYLEEFNKQFPEQPVKAPEVGKSPVINRETGELEFVDPRRLPENIKVPKQLSVSPNVDTVGYALYKVESLNRAIIKARKLGKLDEVSKNLDEIAKYNEQIKTVGKTLSPEDAAKAGNLSEQLRDVKGLKTTKFNPTKAREEIDNLREQWRNTTDIVEKNKLKQRAKVINDRLKKMEGK